MRMTPHRTMASVMAAAALFASAAPSLAFQSTTPAAAAVERGTPVNEGERGPAEGTSQPAAIPAYVLGTGDMIETAVLGRTDFTARVQVQEDGTIQLPFVNTVPAAGRTVLELRNDLRTRLTQGGFLENPAVSVIVASYGSRYVTVLGQVNQPGVVPIDRAYRLTEIVARAGGLSDKAADAVTLTRPDGSSRALSLRTLATSGASDDPPVESGDKVFVAPPANFFIYGQVNAPGSYPIDRPLTVQMALARSGGLTALGSARRVRLVRGGNEMKVALTQDVRPDDVLVVGERFF